MIVCFSGTGNSLDVARRLASLLGDPNLIELSGETLLHADLSVISSATTIWVFPVYSWGVPPVVIDFVRRVVLSAESASGVHHLVVTCGDDCGLVDHQFSRLLKSRRWRAAGAWSVTMPNTYTLMKGFDVDSPEVATRKLTSSVERIGHIASCIASADFATDIKRGAFPWVKSRVIYPWFVRHAMSPRPFHSTDSCVSCGLCARQCPTSNITMGDNGRPVWGDGCALCLRCYHSCPVKAIEYGKATIGKGQYLRIRYPGAEG